MHRRRERFAGSYPIHVTLRVRAGLVSLRDARVVREFRRSLTEAKERGAFRVAHYSLQGDHAHLIVEARDARALASGMKSIGARLARLVNRICRRSGTVLDGRYRHRLLRTPREVRNALRYVLLNARKHWSQRHGAPPPARLDAASSAAWFDGWARRVPRARDPGHAAVARPRTWLLRSGWRRHGLIDFAEVPAPHG
jgi:REP element-mobilizing transposase RayT